LSAETPVNAESSSEARRTNRDRQSSAFSPTGADRRQPRSALAALLLPSTTDLVFVLFLVLLVSGPMPLRLLGDAGIGWHLRTGQQILTTHRIPRVDPFSSTMQGRPWYAWEWLYDVMVGTLELRMELNGAVLFTALVIAAVFAATFRLMLRRGTNLVIALLLVLVAASASMIHFLARPHVLSWLFTVTWFCILDRTETDGRTQRLFWLPVLMVLWVNLHGGFLVAFVLLGIYLLSAIVDSYFLRRDSEGAVGVRDHAGKRVHRLAVVTAVTAAATFANPYGYKLHVHIYEYLSNRFLMDHIDEFRSPNFHGIAEKCFAILLLIAMMALATRLRKVRLSEGLLVLFAAYAGLYASRNIPVSSLLLALVAGLLLSESIAGAAGRAGLESSLKRLLMRLESFSSRMRTMEFSLKGHLWPVLAVAACFAIGLHHGRVGSHVVMDAHFDATRFPVAAADFLEQSGIHDPVFAPDSWGGYLIYRLYPEFRVVVDDRHDLYGEQFLRNYLKAVHLEPGWDAFLNDHHVNCVLMPKHSALANMLVESAEWKQVYSDDVAAVFARRRQP